MATFTAYLPVKNRHDQRAVTTRATQPTTSPRAISRSRSTSSHFRPTVHDPYFRTGTKPPYWNLL